jgi:hypothetical protein
MTNKKIIELQDFSGGYSTDLAPDNKPLKILDKAENVYWHEGKLQKRGGKAQYASIANTCRGSIRAYLNSTWVTILAIDNASSVSFYQGTSTSFTVIDDPLDAAFTLTTGNNVEMRAVKDYVIAVNGVDKPVLIYYDSQFNADWLENYDERTRDNDDWNAGQYTNSGTVYTDDTTDAQQSTADDVPLATTTANDGFFISCYATFSKVVFTSVDAFTGSPVASYQYYDGSAWQTLTLTTTPVWTTGGNLTMIFDWPSAWGKWDGTEDHMANMFCIRVRFTTAPTNTPTCDQITVSDVHYLTAIMADEKPHLIEYHNNRFFLVAGNNVQISPPNQVKNWKEYDVDYFLRGGRRIRGTASYRDYLMVFKDSLVYGLFGNSMEDWVKQSFISKGCASARSIVVALDTVWWVADDGIYGWNGVKEIRVSSHIDSDYSGYTKTDTCGIFFEGRVWMAFPTNSVVLVFDPDSAEQDKEDLGEWRVALYKFPTYRCDQFIKFDGEGDNGKLIGVHNGTTKELRELENANGFDSDVATIPIDIQLKYHSEGRGFHRKKRNRVKVELSKSGNWTFTIYSDDGTVTATAVTVASGTGSGHYREEIGLPYTLDGYNISYRIQNDTVNDAQIYGIGYDARLRKY